MGSFKVIIIGSGLSGALLANGLANNGIDFRVYERDSEDSKREGYQIRIGENALVGMRACLQEEDLSRVVGNIGTNIKVPILHDRWFGKFLDLNLLPNYSKSVPIDRVVLRDIFVRPIRQLGRIHYDKKFTKFEIKKVGEREAVLVFFDDGSTDTCDLLIGADGNRSKVNELLGLNNIKSLEGLTAFLTKCDLPSTLYDTIDQRLLSSPIVTLQDKKLMYFCAFTKTHETPRSTEFNGESSSCMLSLCWPTSLIPTFMTMTLEQRWNAVLKIFQNWSPEHHQIFELCYGQDMFLLSPRVGTKPSSDWRKKATLSTDQVAGNPHVWLMGDAIHPMIPNRGMGGQQAMRDTADALPLILQLAAKASTPAGLRDEDFRAACTSYEQVMIPRAFEWVQKSGGDNYVPFDLSKTLQRIAFRIASYILIPTACSGHWILSWLVGTKTLLDAPEFGR